MSLVPSLLQAIVKVDGEALVMHAGDKPYVVSANGQLDLASRGLTLEAVNGILAQLLPPEIQHALDEFGAISYQLPARPEFPNEDFTVVAARGGDDIWVEVRRRRVVDDDNVPDDLFSPEITPVEPAADDAPPAVIVSSVEATTPVASVPTPDAGTPELAPAAALSLEPVAEQASPDVSAVVSLVGAAPPEPEAIAHADEDEEIELAIDGDDLTLPEEAQLFGQPAAACTESEPACDEEQEIDLDIDIEAHEEPMALMSAPSAPPPMVAQIADAVANASSFAH